MTTVVKIGGARAVDPEGALADIAALVEAGEAYLMWRCWECGEMGRLDADLPDACPSCGAAREELYYWAED